MKKSFWMKKWHQEEIGFHQDRFNSTLIKHFPKLQISKGSQVLVPLCGKSLDMLWLREQGYYVHGVELSSIACRCFLNENQLRYQRVDVIDKPTHLNQFEIYKVRDLSIYEGDFFKFHNQQIDAIYDRAAAVALPLEMRRKYYQHLKSFDAPILMICFEYDYNLRQGPPFAIFEQELKEYFHKVDLIERTKSQHMPAEHNVFETTYYLK